MPVHSVNVGAGYTAWNSVPGSARTSSGTVVPAFDGWFGDVSALSTTLHMAIVAPKGMFTGPRVAGAEPAKSTTKRPSPIVTVTSMRTGSVEMPSSSSQSTAVHDPCGSASRAARVVRSEWARISSTAWSTTSRPNLASTSSRRRSPVRSVAIWACMSPITSRACGC